MVLQGKTKTKQKHPNDTPFRAVVRLRLEEEVVKVCLRKEVSQ